MPDDFNPPPVVIGGKPAAPEQATVSGDSPEFTKENAGDPHPADVQQPSSPSFGPTTSIDEYPDLSGDPLYKSIPRGIAAGLGWAARTAGSGLNQAAGLKDPDPEGKSWLSPENYPTTRMWGANPKVGWLEAAAREASGWAPFLVGGGELGTAPEASTSVLASMRRMPALADFAAKFGDNKFVMGQVTKAMRGDLGSLQQLTGNKFLAQSYGNALTAYNSLNKLAPNATNQTMVGMMRALNYGGEYAAPAMKGAASAYLSTEGDYQKRLQAAGYGAGAAAAGAKLFSAMDKLPALKKGMVMMMAYGGAGLAKQAGLSEDHLLPYLVITGLLYGGHELAGERMIPSALFGRSVGAASNLMGPGQEETRGKFQEFGESPMGELMKDILSDKEMSRAGAGAE